MTAWHTTGRTGPTIGRRFNHDEARARYQAGETKAELARSLGVSTTSLKYALAEVDTRYAMRHWWLERYSLEEIREMGRALL